MKYVYQLVAPVYGWDESTYTDDGADCVAVGFVEVGIFSSLESAVSKAESQMDDATLFIRSVNYGGNDPLHWKHGVTYDFDHEDDWDSGCDDVCVYKIFKMEVLDA